MKASQKIEQPTDQPIGLGMPVIIDVVRLFFFLISLPFRTVLFLWQTFAWSVFSIFLIPLFILRRLSRVPLAIVTRSGDGLSHFFLTLLRILSSSIEAIARPFHRVKAPPFEKKSPPVQLRTDRTESFFLLPDGWLKRSLFFIGIALLVSLPILLVPVVTQLFRVQAETLAFAKRGASDVSRWQESLQSLNMPSAEQSINRAVVQFERAKENLSPLHTFLIRAAESVPLQGKKIADRYALLTAAQQTAQLGIILTDTAKRVVDGGSISRESLVKELPRIADALQTAEPLVLNIQQTLSGIDPASLPEEYRSQLVTATRMIDPLSQNIALANELAKSTLEILGYQAKKRYLVLFQNQTELRPTGGFIGTYALVDVDRGLVQKVEIPGGGSYDLQGSLKELIAPPLPLQRINSRWEFQDANWYSDFPTSAKKLMWFYEKSGGPSVDGVLSINASLFESVLGLIGPISLPEYGKTITADNFIFETQKSVELEYDKTKNTPKAFLRDLFPKALEKLSSLPPDKTDELLSLLITSGLSRSAQIFLVNPKLQSAAVRFGFAGELKNPPADFLSIVDTNIGGGKSDGVVKGGVRHEVAFSPQGSIEVRLVLTKTHNGRKKDLFTNLTHVDYVRIYAPKGSSYLSSKGFHTVAPTLYKHSPIDYKKDISLPLSEQVVTGNVEPIESFEQDDKTVFAGWIETPVGESSTAELTYRLPFTHDQLKKKGGYSLYIQRQSGSHIKNYSLAISLPHTITPTWRTKELSQETDGTFAWSKDPFTHDQLLGFSYQYD